MQYYFVLLDTDKIMTDSVSNTATRFHLQMPSLFGKPNSVISPTMLNALLINSLHLVK